MAFDISYIFQAKDNFTGAARKIQSSMKKVTRSAKKLSFSMKGIGTASATAFKKLSSLKGLLLGAGFIFGFKKFLDVGTSFQDNLAELQSITGAVGDDLDFLSKSATKFSKELGISSSTNGIKIRTS